jgi:uncharacterized protein (TIGR02246 family)
MRGAWIVLPSLLALGCYASDRSASVAQAGTPADRAAVQAAIDAQLATFRDAMIKGDTAGMASIYTDDAIVLPANVPMARGRAAMNAMNAGMFASTSVADMRFATVDLILTGDYAIETGTYRMTIKPKGAPQLVDDGKYVAIWQKQADGSWKMIRDIFNSDKPSS